MRGRSFPVGHRIFPVPQGGRSRPPHLGDLKWRRLRRRGVRRDEGIPPYGRPEGSGRPGLAPNTKFIRRGGIYPARGVRAAANIPGTMRASSPTGVCCNAGPQLPGWPPHSPPSVGADSISARGCLRRRGVRRDGGIPPYGRPEGGGRPGLAPNTKFIRRGGIYPARGTLRRRGVRRDEGIPPYGRPGGYGCPVSRVIFGRFVGAGHAPPAGPCRTANIHGRAMALPYEPAQMPPPSGWCETQNLFVGADSISARGHSRRRRAPGTISGLRAGPAARLASETRLRAQCKHRPLQGGLCNAGPQLPGWPPHRRRPQGPAPQKQNTTNVPPCRISIAAARPRTAS